MILTHPPRPTIIFCNSYPNCFSSVNLYALPLMFTKYRTLIPEQSDVRGSARIPELLRNRLVLFFLFLFSALLCTSLYMILFEIKKSDISLHPVLSKKRSSCFPFQIIQINNRYTNYISDSIDAVLEKPGSDQ